MLSSDHSNAARRFSALAMLVPRMLTASDHLAEKEINDFFPRHKASILISPALVLEFIGAKSTLAEHHAVRYTDQFHVGKHRTGTQCAIVQQFQLSIGGEIGLEMSHVFFFAGCVENHKVGILVPAGNDQIINDARKAIYRLLAEDDVADTADDDSDRQA